MSEDAYSGIAEGYAARVDRQPTNAHYERPAMVAALPDMSGKDVLDAGCGSGWYAERFVQAGARVTSIDLNPDLVRLTRERVGPGSRAFVWDLAQPLSFAPDGSFDLIVAPLVMHYLHDWRPTLKEFARVLRPGGRFLFSTHHPWMDWTTFEIADYFATVEVEDEWDVGKVRFTRRPLDRIASDLAGAGFLIERLIEPRPVDAMKDADPERFHRLSTNPWFLIIRARTDHGGSGP